MYRNLAQHWVSVIVILMLTPLAYVNEEDCYIWMIEVKENYSVFRLTRGVGYVDINPLLYIGESGNAGQ